MTAFPPQWGVTAARKLNEGVGGRVWRATLGDGGSAVAKRLSPAALADAAFALAWLRGQDGEGAVRLLDADEDWQLLEDAGGRTAADLLEADGDEAAARVAASVLRTLHARSGAGDGLQMLPDRLASLRASAIERSGLFAEAAGLAGRLLADAPAPRPLHGDLHHENLLESPRGWLAIDPHGVFGDPAYDAANWLYNPVERDDLRTDPERARRLATILGPAVGRPPEAVLDWAFCHACLSASWHLEDGDADEARRSLDVAEAIHRAKGG